MLAQKDLFFFSGSGIVSKTKFVNSVGKIVAKSAFVDVAGDNGIEVPASMIHTYKKFSVKTANRSYNVLLQGTDSQMQENGMYECFSITTSDGKTLLTQWGKNPLCKVGNLTQVKNTDEFFIQVPLDDESIALIFAGWLFETSNEAGEMIVVVVNRDEATVVFDKPAFGTSYMPHPKFSLSFVSDVFWPDDESADPKAITIPPFLKYEIWKQGNMLKYRSRR